MIKLLKKLRDWIYNISYSFENLAEKIGDVIVKYEPPKKSTMSDSMKLFFDEIDKEAMLRFCAEDMFPKKNYGGGKVEFRKFSELPNGSFPLKRSFGDVFCIDIDKDEQGI